MKKFLILAAALLVSSVSLAADVTISWSEPTNPAAGWNLYYNHLQTPDALQYLGSIAPSERSMVFHNISTTGLYQLAISRVGYTDVSGVNRRTETALSVVTILDGQYVSTFGDVVITGVSIVL